MEDLWLFGLRGAGISLSVLLGVLIVFKGHRWHDPALAWLLIGLSVGPIIVLSWNILYRVWLVNVVAPTDRLTFPLLAGMQFRYLYEIVNKVLDFACVLAIAIGITKLYRNAHERVRLLPSAKAVTNDPRN